MTSASFDVTIRTVIDGQGKVNRSYHDRLIPEVEQHKRARYFWIGNPGTRTPALFAPLVFSPLGYVSDELVRLCWILGSAQSKRHVQSQELDLDDEDDATLRQKFYRSLYFRRAVARLQATAILAGIRRYFKDRIFAKGVYSDASYPLAPCPTFPPMDLSLC